MTKIHVIIVNSIFFCSHLTFLCDTMMSVLNSVTPTTKKKLPIISTAGVSGFALRM